MSVETENLPPPESLPEAAPVRKGPSFAELGLRSDVLRALEDMGFVEPMDVQAAVLPLARAGRDLMVQSRTGSGKTAAFGIPFIDAQVDASQKHVQAIVLLPTRELALQVASELARIAQYSGVTVVPVYGGAPMGRQVEQLRAGGQVVCGTPGRVLDHLRRGTLKLDGVKVAVLDECDEMLSMGFQEDIEAILERTPETRQTFLFSATVPEGIQRLARRFLKNPEFLKLSADFVGVHEIRHVYYSIPGGDREKELLRILEFEEPRAAIIFCNTRDETGRVAEFLRKHGYEAEAISSDLSQSDRERVMEKTRAGGVRFLVATDVAARGIDIENLPFVFNYTFPESPEVYIHRTGRTGRAGKSGTAVSLIGPSEVGPFYYLKLLYKIRPEERALPSETEIRSKREGERVLILRAALPDDPGADWKGLARRLIGAPDGERLVGSVLAKVFADQEGLPAAPPPPKAAPVFTSPAPRPAYDDAARPRRDDRGDRGDRPSYGAGPRRDRPSFGGDGPRRDRDRGGRPERGSRDRDRGRERGPGGPGGAGRRDRTGPSGAAPVKGAGPIRTEEKEFWEAWSEEKAAAANATPPIVAGDAPAGTGDTANWGGLGAAVEAPTPKPIASAPLEQPHVPDGMVRLYLNLGRKDGVAEGDVSALITEHAGVSSAPVMEIMNTHTYMNVPADDADRIVAGLSGKRRGERDIMCERARPRGSGGRNRR